MRLEIESAGDEFEHAQDKVVHMIGDILRTVNETNRDRVYIKKIQSWLLVSIAALIVSMGFLGYTIFNHIGNSDKVIYATADKLEKHIKIKDKVLYQLGFIEDKITGFTELYKQQHPTDYLHTDHKDK